MNNKILYIQIAPLEDSLQQFAQVWKTGKPVGEINRLTFESMGSFLKILTTKRWELLTKLRKEGGMSINQLAKLLKRNYKNVHTDVTNLMELGLIEKNKEGLVFVPWDEIETHLKLAA